MRLLLKSGHGLGDCVALTAVIHHLIHYYPDWEIDVAVGLGKHSAFPGLVRNVYLLGQEPGGYDRTIDLSWHENHKAYGDCPSTKATLCLREVFHVEPIWDLLAYSIDINGDAVARATAYLAGLPITDKGYAVLHTRGNTSPDRKNLSDDEAREIAAWLTEQGLVVVELDWDHRTSLTNGRTIFNPDTDNPLWVGYGTGDAATIAALISGARVCVAVDSGPQKVAFATNTPTVCPWVSYHPVNYVDHAPDAVHVIPHNHAEHIRGNPSGPLSFFEGHYRYSSYDPGCLAGAVIVEVARILDIPAPAMHGSYLLKSKAYDVHYYQQHRRAGLDYIGHGDWQVNYGAWVVDALGLAGKKLLDVGCACGSIACGMGKAGALVSGIDLSEYMISLGRERWLRQNLHVCDAVNLHLFADDTFDAIHSNQVAEHWKAELVPFILRELNRVTRPGGVFWCVLDTAESFAREGRKLGHNEDATHVCIKPLAWWQDQAIEAGWHPAPDVLAALRDHPASYYRSYQWDSFALRKPVNQVTIT